MIHVSVPPTLMPNTPSRSGSTCGCCASSVKPVARRASSDTMMTPARSVAIEIPGRVSHVAMNQRPPVGELGALFPSAAEVERDADVTTGGPESHPVERSRLAAAMHMQHCRPGLFRRAARLESHRLAPASLNDLAGECNDSKTRSPSSQESITSTSSGGASGSKSLQRSSTESNGCSSWPGCRRRCAKDRDDDGENRPLNHIHHKAG